MNADQPDKNGKEKFRRAEWNAIQVHRYYLSQRYQRWVSLEEAIQSWLQNHSQKWRDEQMKKAQQSQCDLILKHKWIESEKMGHDVGKSAVLDWIKNYAAQWRKWWEEQEEQNN